MFQKTLFAVILVAIGSIHFAANASGDDPDMSGREGVPPNSVGSGTR